MDESELKQYVDQQRWLLNNGLISDGVKNQLFFCGSIVHKDVQAVELNVDPEKKVVNYTVFINADLLGKMERYKELSTSTSVFGMWKFKRLLKKEGSLDFQKVLGRFVTDFCGPKWQTTVQVLDFAKYVEDSGEEGGSLEGSQQFN